MKTSKTHTGNEYVTVSLHLKIQGKTVRRKVRNYINRRSETSAFTLEDLGQILFMWERMFSGGTTYSMDGLLQSLEKIMPKRNNETAQEVFEKYWINLEKTLSEDFEEQNSGNGPIFKMKGDYLKYCIGSLTEHFSRESLPTKHAFLYWMIKYVFNDSFDEIKEDLKKTPVYIKKFVDSQMK